MRNYNKNLTATFIGLFTLAAGTTLLAAPDPRPGQQGQQQQQRAQGQQGQQGATASHVDLVIALDTSSSMDGLIDGARQKLWDVGNLLAQARPRPILRVGLLSYGNDGYDAGKGWVRKESDLTTDLDGIYARLFALRTNGGSEYVARAVRDATREMRWSQESGTLKIIFVAGNEPANQDPQVQLVSAVQGARQKGIFVNAIYCGADGGGEAVSWRQVAALGSGQYAAIDQNQIVTIAAPQDAELARLSGELNKTYVAYGTAGGMRAEQQAAQDKNAQTASAPAAASRAAAKASALYRNDDWDLVDARNRGKDIGKMKAEELPEPLRKLDSAARDHYLTEKAKERETLQKKIATVNGERETYLKAERARRAGKGAKALDDALGEAIRKEATSAGFAF